ncbi:MAG: hypothetical protein MJ133_03845 [Lachnospiraceae bacterium]|nr:hypothetical protein [Lachnospiraceae bacterium]
MRSPKDMSKIQIDITNACGNICSNCTRFCGHHKSTFFMNYETFCKAVDSLEDYEGIVGLIGGEPTLHPEFEKFVDYIREKRIGQNVQMARKPIYDMQEYIDNNLFNLDSRVGLWSSLSNGYYKNFEVINDTFRTQLLNDHNNTCMHQALLMPRKELGISDEEWIEKRDACWIQNTWSATITPKGAFFCEVAGALDMLFDGPGGWPIEKGWWKRDISGFKDQLHWCEMCSGCLDVPKRISNDGHDDVTPEMYEKLMEIGSPKAKRGMCVVHNPQEYDKTKYHTFIGENDYMDLGNNQRTTKENRNLYPKSFLHSNWEEINSIVNDAKDWILVDQDKEKLAKVEKILSEYILNPGCLYVFGETLVFNVRSRALRDIIINGEILDKSLWRIYPVDKIINISDLKVNVLNENLIQLEEEKKIVIYGAGRRGKELMSWFINKNKLKQIVAWSDKKYKEMGYPIVNPEEIKNIDHDLIFVAIEKKDIFEEIKKELVAEGISESSVKWIDACYTN